MKELLDKVSLLNRTTGKFETAELFHGIDKTNLSHIEGRRSLAAPVRVATGRGKGVRKVGVGHQR